MSTQTVFSAEGDQTTDVKVENKIPESPESAFANQLAEIRNERGEPKYKDLQAALEALKHSQEYIPSLKSDKEKLEQELEAARQELLKRKSVEEFMDRLKPTQQEAPMTQPDTTSVNGLTQEQVMGMLEQLVPNYISQHQQQSVEQQNILSVDQKLKEAYGDKVQDVVKRRMEELGVTAKDLEQLSAKSPKMVLSLFDVKPQGNPKPNMPSVNLPLGGQPKTELARPERSLLSGATSKQQAEYMAKIKEGVYSRHGIQS